MCAIDLGEEDNCTKSTSSRAFDLFSARKRWNYPLFFKSTTLAVTVQILTNSKHITLFSLSKITDLPLNCLLRVVFLLIFMGLEWVHCWHICFVERDTWAIRISTRYKSWVHYVTLLMFVSGWPNRSRFSDCICTHRIGRSEFQIPGKLKATSQL